MWKHLAVLIVSFSPRFHDLLERCLALLLRRTLQERQCNARDELTFARLDGLWKTKEYLDRNGEGAPHRADQSRDLDR